MYLVLWLDKIMLDEEIHLIISESKDLACDIVNVEIGFLLSPSLYPQIHWYLKRVSLFFTLSDDFP